jgi:pyridoxamine 5'-phosphate oxidase
LRPGAPLAGFRSSWKASPVMPSITHRHDYEKAALDESAVDRDPFRQFSTWFEEATAAGIPEPNAMSLATASPEGRPSARIVLMRGFDERGFVFFTNYESRKGREIEANPFVSLIFFWQALERQVRVEGTIVKADAVESDEYFQSRPTGSKLGAWVSNQSGVVAGREALESEMAAIEGRFPGGEIPRPPHWGGFRVVPSSVEFWQGRRSRLHDRLVYRKSDEGDWRIERLAP